MSSTNTAETILKLLPLLNKKFIRSMHLELRTILTSMQINVLVALVEKKATMTELSNEILIPKQQMTPLIDKLVSEGFVQREYDAIDRRIIRISITPLGLDILVKIKEKALAVLETKLKDLDQNDLLYLNQALTDICKIINKIT